MNIKVLGGGCRKCETLLANAKAAAAQKGIDAEIEYITDFARIASYGIMSTPALMIDGKTVSAGRVLSAKEIEALRQMGLGLGGTIESVIVYNDEGWLNPLHFEDELVRHKILDVIGDLRLSGPIRGHVIAVASGHALNTQLAKKIAAELG